MRGKALAGEGSVPDGQIPYEHTFEGFLDIEWLEVTDDRAEVTFEARDNLKQAFGLVHGGIYSAVAESVASVATVRAVWADGLTGSGLSNCASFLRPVTAGTVHVSARRRSHDEREWLWGLEFRDDAGRLCSLVDVTIAIRPRRPASVASGA